MAMYEFERPACAERFQVTVPMREHDRLKEQPPTCPKCGQQHAHQVVSHFACKTPSGY